MRTIQDLKCSGVKFSPELKEKFMAEVEKRYDGIIDGTLDEPLGEIIINKYTAISLEEQLNN